MQNLTDSEMLLFVGFLVLCVCVLFMWKLCLKHGCLRRLHNSESHTNPIEQNFASRLYRPSSPNLSNPAVAKKKHIWVDTSLKDEK